MQTNPSKLRIKVKESTISYAKNGCASCQSAKFRAEPDWAEPLSGIAGNSPLKLPILKAKLIVAVARRIEPSKHM